MKCLFVMLLEIKIIFFSCQAYCVSQERFGPEVPFRDLDTLIDKSKFSHMLSLYKISLELSGEDISQIIFINRGEIPKSVEETIESDSKNLFLYLLKKSDFRVCALRSMLECIDRKDLVGKLSNLKVDDYKGQLSAMALQENQPTLSGDRKCDADLLNLISNGLSQEDLKGITFLYAPVIPESQKKDLERGGLNLFNYLLSLDGFGVPYLKKILENIKRMDLLSQVKTWEGQNRKNIRESITLNPPLRSNCPSPYPEYPPPPYSTLHPSENRQPSESSDRSGEPFVKCVIEGVSGGRGRKN